MRVTTFAMLPGPPEEVWPLLCASRMDPQMPCAFRFGIPKPVECRLPDGQGGVGARRQCLSDHGVVNQRITHWERPRLLRFHMEDTTLYFGPCVTSMVEEFELSEGPCSTTRIRRTTTLQLGGFLRRFRGLLLCLGIKLIHRYVFRNWARLVATPRDAGEGTGGPASGGAV
jgi:hypothetical protein